MVVHRLLASDHRKHFGQHLFHQAGLDHDVHAARGATFSHQAHDFLADALGGNLRHHRRGQPHRLMRLGLDGEIQARGETRGAHHAQMILGEAIVGIPDRADDPGAQIAHPADGVDQAILEGIVVHAADGEVAALRVLLDGAEADRRRTAAIDIRSVGAEGGDLERFALDDHHDDAELRAHRDGVVEQALHDLGTRIGRDVVILDGDSEQAIAHTSAVEERDEAVVAQAAQDREGLFFLRGHGGHFTGMRGWILQGIVACAGTLTRLSRWSRSRRATIAPPDLSRGNNAGEEIFESLFAAIEAAAESDAAIDRDRLAGNILRLFGA